MEHSGIPCGEIVHLEINHKTGDLWAIAHVADDVEGTVNVVVGNEVVPLQHDLYWSASRIGGKDDGLLLTGAALTTTPARVAAAPVRILDGKLDHTRAPDRWPDLEPHERRTLERAAAAHLSRARGQAITIAGAYGDDDWWLARADALDEQQWQGRPLRHSGARGRIIDVR